ncbi:MAG: LytTR family DNA-binding domain-containing protein [Bacteroidota bacterium]
MLNCLIIDDEKDARDALRILVKKFVPKVKIIGEAEGVKSGLAQIEKTNPQVVFLDINMQDGTGFDLLDQLEEVDFHLVFITAYDQYAIKAFKYAALDYLLKPIDLQELRKCVQRIEQLQQPTDTLEKLASLQSSSLLQELLSKQKTYKERFTIKKASGIYLLTVADVSYFFADDNLVFAVDQNNKRHVISHRINELEELLNPRLFFRINRSEIVNIHFIQKMESYFANRLIIQLRNSEVKLKTSTPRTAAFRKWLEG